MKNNLLAVGLTAIGLVLSLAILSAPSAVVAEPEDVFADTPTPEPPTSTPTATWSGKLFLPFGGRAEATPTSTVTATPTPTAMPTPRNCVFPEPTTPGVTVDEGVWVLAKDGRWIVHNPAVNGRIVIRFDVIQLISLWSVDNEQRREGAQPAIATLDSGIQVQLPWTGDMEVVPVPDGPWTTQTLTVIGAAGDSPGIRWCSWQ